MNQDNIFRLLDWDEAEGGGVVADTAGMGGSEGAPAGDDAPPDRGPQPGEVEAGQAVDAYFNDPLPGQEGKREAAPAPKPEVVIAPPKVDVAPKVAEAAPVVDDTSELAKAKARIAELEGYQPLVDYFKDKGAFKDATDAQAKIAEQRTIDRNAAMDEAARKALAPQIAECNAAIESGEYTREQALAYLGPLYETQRALIGERAKTAEIEGQIRAIASQRAELDVARETAAAIEQYPILNRDGMTDVLHRLALSTEGGIPAAAKMLGTAFETAQQAGAVAQAVAAHAAAAVPPIMSGGSGGAAGVPQSTLQDAAKMTFAQALGIKLPGRR